MGFLDRLHDVATGIGGAVQAPVGLAWDLTRAPFVDDDVDGILGTLTATTTSRTAQLFGNLVGPDEGLGAVVGVIPGREHLRGPIGALNRGLETAYREGVSQPLSGLLTAGSLASSPDYLRSQGRGTGVLDQFAALGDLDLWRDAEDIAETRSPGQALAVMIGTKDLMDEEEMERFVGTDAYVFVSGTADALTRIFLSPDVIAGKAVTAGRAGRLAADGGRIGVITARVPFQMGRGAEAAGAIVDGGRIASINAAIDRAYLRLPESVQCVVAADRSFLPEETGRLQRFEETRRLVATGRLEGEAMRSTDPTRVRVLSSIVESRRAREARIGAGEVSSGADVGGVTRQVAEQTQADIDAYFAAANNPTRKGFFSGITRTPGWRRVNDFIDTLSTEPATRAAEIRDRLFPSHHRGDIIATALADAQGVAERESVMRVFLGDMRALRSLDQSNYALARRLEDLAIEQAAIRAEPVLTPIPARSGGQLSLLDEASPIFDDHRNTAERLARIGEEIDAVSSEEQLRHRLTHAFGSLPAGPTVTRGQVARSRVKASSLYQNSALGKAVRLVTDMRPHHLVSTEDNLADAQLARMLREAGYDDDAIAQARGQFMAQQADTRGPAFQRWVERAERRVLERHGLDEDEIGQVLAQASIGKRRAEQFVRSAKFDGEGRARVRFHDGDEIVDLEMPMSVTQLQNVVVAPNFALLNRAAERYARLKYGDDWRSALARGAKPAWTAKEYGLEGLRGFMDVWRPAVLLRPAWTMRVIGDEMLRQVAKFGALSVMLDARRGINDYGAELKRNPIVRRVLRTEDPVRAGRRGAAVSAAAGAAVAGPFGAIASGALGNRLVKKMAQAEEAGYLNIRFGGHSISGPFGDAGSTSEIYRVLNSARQSVDELFGLHESRILGSLRRDPKRWKTHVWGESAEANEIYRGEWARNLRRQIAQDEMGRQFLAGRTPEDVLNWLDNTLEGRAYAAKIPWRRDHEAWVEAHADQVDAYTGGVDGVKVGVLNLADDASEAEAAKLLDLIPEHQRAPIHGAATDQMQARSPLNEAVGSFVDNAFDLLGTMATDTLSRNPTFARFYQAEARRLFSSIKPGDLHEAMLTRLEGQARDFALRETRELLYDLAEQSRFASMTRLLMPFYSAWQEVLTRWAGLAVENPVFIARARQAWSAPDKVGWTYTDDHGSTFLRLRIPAFARGLLNQGALHSALDSQGYVFLDKNGLNLVAQGTPGFGPFAQIAVSEMVEKNPSLEDSVRFIIPFGPVDATEALLPPTVKRAMAAAGDEEGAARANIEARILTTKLAQIATGDLPMVDFSDPAARQAFLEQVDAEADQVMKLRLFSGFVAPVTPIYESPYKPYIDIYRALRDGDWERARDIGRQFDVRGSSRLPTKAPRKGASRTTTADDIFIDAFGEEFFALTQAFTETVDGVPPTVEGLEASERWGDLISAYPEWGGVIAGYDGGGDAVKFSRAVYDRQTADGSRRRLTADEVLDGPNRRLGWARYSSYMDAIEML